MESKMYVSKHVRLNKHVRCVFMPQQPLLGFTIILRHTTLDRTPLEE